MINREQVTRSKNKFYQACRTTAETNNILQNFYVLRTSMVTNIFTKFTGLAGLIHMQAGHDVSCFNIDLTKGWCGRSFLLKKKLFFRLIAKRLWISFPILESFWLCHKTSQSLFFLQFLPSGQNFVKMAGLIVGLEGIWACQAGAFK